MSRSTDPAEMAAWLTGRLAELLELAPEEIDVTVPLDGLGVTSMEEVTVVAELEERYGLTIPVADLRRHPTVEALCSHLAGFTPAEVSRP
ncbi:acyl carrier protein [Kitasatospora aureofaciens]|uniref:acyl carrier protein n=1 Tax=Kitasatospora aureofaciens TaxID=1894 RepID=UPI001C43E630|nr:acyl carrier protein [Kitasatospora aureofaciens]MBV6699941.1 acyl carrier protein [Kitasatospora aureofaciens]